MAARMRTAAGALKIIQQEDPDTAVTLHYIRGLIKSGRFPSVSVGRKQLINVDAFLRFLEEEKRSAWVSPPE